PTSLRPWPYDFQCTTVGLLQTADRRTSSAVEAALPGTSLVKNSRDPTRSPLVDVSSTVKSGFPFSAERQNRTPYRLGARCAARPKPAGRDAAIRARRRAYTASD